MFQWQSRMRRSIASLDDIKVCPTRHRFRAIHSRIMHEFDIAP